MDTKLLIFFFLWVFFYSSAKCESNADASAVGEADPAIVLHRGTPLPPLSQTPFSTLSSLAQHHQSPISLTTPYPGDARVHRVHPKLSGLQHQLPHGYGHPNNPVHVLQPILPVHGSKYCADYSIEPPICSYNTTKPLCLLDYEYPSYEIKSALQFHRKKVLGIYVDVADLSSENSVVPARNFYDETYLCPSEINYVRPLRAVNTNGQWRTIVNDIKIDYDIFTQTMRLEECLSYGKPCPLVPSCMNSKCLQKSMFQRFLVFDPCDSYFPFAIETFKIPSSCSCTVGELYIRH